MYHLDECTTGQEINFEGGCSDCKLDKYQPVDMPTSTDKCLSCKENYGTKQKMSNSCLREFYLLDHSSCMVFFVGKNVLWISIIINTLFYSHLIGSSNVLNKVVFFLTSAMCPEGQFFNQLSMMCERCPKGSWNNGNLTMKFEECIACPVNFTTTGRGMTSDANCIICTHCNFIQKFVNSMKKLF